MEQYIPQQQYENDVKTVRLIETNIISLILQIDNREKIMSAKEDHKNKAI